jgi:hypothetical protein
MFRRLTAAAGILLATTALAAPAANAEIAPIGDVPAATLLLPYFEVDLGQPAQGSTSMDNVLWGDYYYVDPGAGQANQADQTPIQQQDNRGHGGRHGGHGRN